MAGPYAERQRQLIAQLAQGRPALPAGRALARREDYPRDPALCLTSLVLPAPDLARALHRRLIRPLAELAPRHYWYPSAALHLTVKAIRTASDPPSFGADDVARAQAVFSELIPRHPAFAFSLEDVVLLVGSVQLVGYCDERLDALVRDLDRGLAEVGLPDDKRYASGEVFFGNITLARLVGPPGEPLRAAVTALGRGTYGELLVREVQLVTCNLVCAPDTRRVLGSYRLHS